MPVPTLDEINDMRGALYQETHNSSFSTLTTGELFGISTSAMGAYVCMANNSFATNSSTITIKIEGKLLNLLVVWIYR